ncbi:MAG: nuclear transport factor 2 family protein [Tahibacter sp.]
MQHIDDLRRIATEHGPAPEAGSPAEADALARFRLFFADFSPDKVERLLDATYAEHLYFDDTLKQIHDREVLRHYLRDSATAVEACRVEILQITPDGQGNHYVRWRMCIRFRRFARGRDTWSIGVSHIRFDAQGRVVFHQDYWNAAVGLFQHVPVLGWMIRAIQRRL